MLPVETFCGGFLNLNKLSNCPFILCRFGVNCI